MKEIGRLTQYSVWGFVTFLLGLGVLYLLHEAGVYYWLAVPLSVSANLVTHYAAARLFVFTEATRPHEEGLAIFVLVGVLEILLISGGVALLVELAGTNLYWTRIGVGAIVAVIGFAINARYNFKAL